MSPTHTLGFPFSLSSTGHRKQVTSTLILTIIPDFKIKFLVKSSQTRGEGIYKKKKRKIKYQIKCNIGRTYITALLEVMIRFVWFNWSSPGFFHRTEIKLQKRDSSATSVLDYIPSMKPRGTKRDNHKLQIASMFRGPSDKDKWEWSSECIYLSRQASLLNIQMKRKKEK